MSLSFIFRLRHILLSCVPVYLVALSALGAVAERTARTLVFVFFCGLGVLVLCAVWLAGSQHVGICAPWRRLDWQCGCLVHNDGFLLCASASPGAAARATTCDSR